MKNGIVTRKLAEMEETLRRLREHLPDKLRRVRQELGPAENSRAFIASAR